MVTLQSVNWCESVSKRQQLQLQVYVSEQACILRSASWQVSDFRVDRPLRGARARLGVRQHPLPPARPELLPGTSRRVQCTLNRDVVA